MEAAGTAAVTTGKGNAQGSREKMEEIIEMTDVLKKVPVREQDPTVSYTHLTLPTTPYV